MACLKEYGFGAGGNREFRAVAVILKVYIGFRSSGSEPLRSPITLNPKPQTLQCSTRCSLVVLKGVRV